MIKKLLLTAALFVSVNYAAEAGAEKPGYKPTSELFKNIPESLNVVQGDLLSSEYSLFYNAQTEAENDVLNAFFAVDLDRLESMHNDDNSILTRVKMIWEMRRKIEEETRKERIEISLLSLLLMLSSPYQTYDIKETIDLLENSTTKESAEANLLRLTKIFSDSLNGDHLQRLLDLGVDFNAQYDTDRKSSSKSFVSRLIESANFTALHLLAEKRALDFNAVDQEGNTLLHAVASMIHNVQMEVVGDGDTSPVEFLKTYNPNLSQVDAQKGLAARIINDDQKKKRGENYNIGNLLKSKKDPLKRSLLLAKEANFEALNEMEKAILSLILVVNGGESLSLIPKLAAGVGSISRFINAQTNIYPELLSVVDQVARYLILQTKGAEPVDAYRFIDTLLKMGVDINAKNKDGSTALDLAKHHENTALAKYLESKGAKSSMFKKGDRNRVKSNKYIYVVTKDDQPFLVGGESYSGPSSVEISAESKSSGGGGGTSK